MDETTTNDAPVVDAGVAEQVTQPDVQEQAAADDTTAEHQPDTSNPEPDTKPDNSEVDSKTFTPEWLQSKGIDPNDPEAFQKVANMAFNSEKLMTKKATELEKQIGQPSVDENASSAEKALAIAQSLQNEKIIREWKENSQVTPDEDNAMGKYVSQNPRIGQALLDGTLTLDELRSMSVPAAKVDTQAIKQLGGQEALEKLANKQRATAVQGNAVSTTPTTSLNKGNVEAWYENLGTAGRKNPENQAILQSILSQ